MLIRDITPPPFRKTVQLIHVTDLSPNPTIVAVSRTLKINADKQARLMYYSKLAQAHHRESSLIDTSDMQSNHALRRFSIELAQSMQRDARLTRNASSLKSQDTYTVNKKFASFYKEHTTSFKIKRLRTRIKTSPYNK